MAVAFPIAAGVTLAITGAVGGLLKTGGRLVPLASSAVLALAASIFAAAAGRGRARATNAGAWGRKGDRTRHLRGHFHGRLLSHSPVWRVGEEGLGPYGTAVLFRRGNVAFYVFAKPVFSEFSS